MPHHRQGLDTSVLKSIWIEQRILELSFLICWVVNDEPLLILSFPFPHSLLPRFVPCIDAWIKCGIKFGHKWCRCQSFELKLWHVQNGRGYSISRWYLFHTWFFVTQHCNSNLAPTHGTRADPQSHNSSFPFSFFLIVFAAFELNARARATQ